MARRFRDLTAMKSQHTLGIHLALSARLREEESRQQEADHEYLNILRRLKHDSDGRLFRVAREYCHVLHSYGGNLVFSATVTPEYSAHYLEALVDTPAWEQGGPGDWTWAVKNEEVTRSVIQLALLRAVFPGRLTCLAKNSCINVVQLAGWCWPGYDVVIERARRAIKEQHILLNQQGHPQAQQPSHTALSRPPYPPHGNGELPYPPQNGWSRTSQEDLPPHPDYPVSYQVEPPRHYGAGPSRQAPFSSMGGLSENMHPGPGSLHPLHHRHASPPQPPFAQSVRALPPLRAPPQHPNLYHHESRPGELDSQHMRLPSLSDYRSSPSGSPATRTNLPSLSVYSHPSAPPQPPS